MNANQKTLLKTSNIPLCTQINPTRNECSAAFKALETSFYKKLVRNNLFANSTDRILAWPQKL